jgi:hypothetical protein
MTLEFFYTLFQMRIHMGTLTTFANRSRSAFVRRKFLVVAIAFVMTACGGRGEPEPASPSNTGGTSGSGGGGGGGGSGTFTATLEWEAPTTNVDQSCLTNLAGYTVTYGNASGATNYQESIPLGSLACVNTSTVTACGTVQTCTYTVRGLSSGQWYFKATTYNTDLISGAASNEAALTIN